MLYNNYVIKYILIYVFIVWIGGCETQAENFKKEAEDFCEVHNPDHWVSFRQGKTIQDLKIELDNRIDEAIHSNEFKGIVENLNDVKYLSELYGEAQKNIRQLTKDAWDCAYYKEFYSVSWKRENQNEVNIQKQNDTLMLKLSPERLRIGSDQIITYDISLIKKVISDGLKQSVPLAILNVEQGVSNGKINIVMKALQQSGVKKVSILSN